MAKSIQISTDGTTFFGFPGSQGEFSIEGEQVTDSIFGQTFESAEVGLLSSTISTDGIWKGFAGYKAKIMRAGTPTAATDLAMELESGKIYTSTDQTKAIWARSPAVTVEDGGTPVDAADIEWIDYLFGRVKFVDAYTVVGVVTVNASWMATSHVGNGNSYTLTMSANTKNVSHFEAVQANGGYNIFEPGLRTVSLEVQGIYDAAEAAVTNLAARNELIIEIDAAGNGSSIARGFFKISNTGQSGAVGATEDETMNFTLQVPDDETIYSVFNWKHTSSTLNMAIRTAINSWLLELYTYTARYLPDGTIGGSPLTGKEVDVVITDISLSGGLSNMNTFNVEMQGTGAVTLV